MKIYVASSWKTALQPDVVRRLQTEGHQVYDFRHPAPGNNGFSWTEVGLPAGPMTARDARRTLTDIRARNGFDLDMAALRSCDVCVLLQPSGRSAHLELGWAAGAGKLTIVFLVDGEPPDLMYRMTDRIVTTMDELLLDLSVMKSR